MDKILLGHGSGGKLMHELIRRHFSPAFGIEDAGDSAVVNMPSCRLAYTTDSYVVTPLFFPGGDIGDLAVNGTVNDLAVAGAEPLYLTAGFVIEEGFAISDLTAIISSMSAAAAKAGVKIVAGDTKVVNRGKADGIFINTSGVGALPDGRAIAASNIRAGDKIIISGEVGSHGVSVLSERNNISFSPPIVSDTRPLNGLVRAMYDAAKEIHFMRDPTRGGLATTLKETALESGLGIRIAEQALPIPRGVKGACSLLGLDPLYVANEGILIAIIESSVADSVLSAMRRHEHGTHSAVIGSVAESPPGMVLLETAIGGTRVIDMLQGEQLPRIC
ncbi:MAG TPA: hydrogenase expression/formation protein HypE [Nitrospirota bacterium]